jgi:hypothetical protein
MDWQTVLTALFGSGAATTLVIVASVKWAKDRATNYLDTSVVEAIKTDHTKKIEELKSELTAKMELLKGNIAAEVEYRKFELPAYKELWAALAGVKLAGDLLWKKAEVNNLSVFRQKLAAAEQQVHGLAPLLPDNDYQKLASLIEEFQKFGVGKEGLIQLRDYEYAPDHDNYPIEYQYEIDRIVRENGERRDRYNDLLKAMQARSREHLHRPLSDARANVPANAG